MSTPSSSADPLVQALKRIETARRERSELLTFAGLGLTTEHLATLCPEIAALTALTTLYLSGNQLTTLPEAVGNLTALTELFLSENQLTTLPEAVGNLTALTALYLRGNQLTTLPEAVGNLTALTTLDLRQNQLTTLPEAVGNLTALMALELSFNQLTTLPEAVGNLTALTTLSLSGNQLTTLPEAVGNLTALTVLDLEGNRLTSLPEAVGNLKALTMLYLGSNPLPADLIKLANKNVTDALTYIRELKKDGGGKPIREAKLVIVGEGRVGKTCLLRALKGEDFIEGYQSTSGVDVAVEPLVLTHAADAVPAPYTLNAWDFAGQDIYRVTHQFFFTHRAIYLVLWHVRAGPTQGAVEFWLDTIRQRVGPHARVFVVATHVETEKAIEDLRKEDLKRKYGEMIVDFASVDSRTRFGVEELKAKIAATTANLPEINDPVPRKYLAARDEVDRAIGTEWTTFSKFTTASRLDHAGARRLASLLSMWGRIVYFGESRPLPSEVDTPPRAGTLANYVVLKPEWLTKAIALILEDEQTKKEHAVLKHNRLPAIWETHGKSDRPTYARDNHPFLMALMEKFGISFRLGNNPEEATTSLVPQLIRNDRPERGAAMPWVPGDAAGGMPEASLSCVLTENPPPGLVPLMIARTHHLSCEDTHWMSGAFLRHERFGEAHMQLVDRELRFVARGIFPPHLLGELSATADRLLKEWEGVNWELAVPCPICPTVLAPGKPHGNFPLEAIAAFKKDNPDSESLLCYTCRKSVKIERLLSGWPGGAGPLARMEEKLDGLARGVAKMQDGIDQLLFREPQSAAEAAEQFSRLYAFLTDQRKHAPTTFSVICEEPAGWWTKKFMGLFRVTLWCENPHGPHPVVQIGSSTKKQPVSGEYLIPFSNDWMRCWAPAIKWGLFALKAAVPVTGAVLKASVDEALFKGIEKQLNIGEKVIAALPSGGPTTVKRPIVEEGLMQSPDGVELREFHAAMAEHFKDGQWGDLMYAELPDKSWRWMCKKCRAILSPGIQKSLGKPG